MLIIFFMEIVIQYFTNLSMIRNQLKQLNSLLTYDPSKAILCGLNPQKLPQYSLLESSNDPLPTKLFHPTMLQNILTR